MASSGLLESLLAGLQASVSVLLVITYGGIAAKLGLLTPESTKAVSKVCVRMFLPALLVTKIGSELHAGSAGNYGIVLIWGLLAHFVSFLVGIFGHLVLGMPDWVTVGVMFNNTASYPLLLIGALQQTGILSALVRTGETVDSAIERANAYFLVFSTVSSCLTFAVGPRLIDTEHAPEDGDSSDSDSEETQVDQDSGQPDNNNTDGPSEETGLLSNIENHVPTFQNPFSNKKDHRSFFPSTRKPSGLPGTTSNKNRGKDRRRASLIPHTHWSSLSPRTRWWLLFLFDFFNMPLIGALLGVLIGLTPALHRAFFNDTYDGGIFTAWLTASLKNIGGLFVPLPVVIAGTSLYSAYTKSKGQAKGLPWGTVTYIMIVRFVLWPVVSIGLVYLLASRTTVLGEDPMLWFTMMLMPWWVSLIPPPPRILTSPRFSRADNFYQWTASYEIDRHGSGQWCR